MCYQAYVIMHVKDPQLSVIRVWHYVPLAGFCLSLYSLHVLNRDINIIEIQFYVIMHMTDPQLLDGIVGHGVSVTVFCPSL